MTGPFLADQLMITLSQSLDDIEETRKKTSNRLFQLTNPDTFAYPEDDPAVLWLKEQLDNLKTLEKLAVKHLEKQMAKHPLAPWCDSKTGIGRKQLPRLLAIIGDPYWMQTFDEDGNTTYDGPRNLYKLFAYCGYHVRDGEAPRRRRGEHANWNATARMRIYLLAEKCIWFKGGEDKNGNPSPLSPYRTVYDDTRTKYADAVHTQPCIQCGTKGKPADAGTPLKDGHKHARALRAVSKQLLKDLYNEAKRLHQQQAAAKAFSMPRDGALLPAPTTEDSHIPLGTHGSRAVLGQTSIAS